MSNAQGRPAQQTSSSKNAKRRPKREGTQLVRLRSLLLTQFCVACIFYIRKKLKKLARLYSPFLTCASLFLRPFKTVKTRLSRHRTRDVVVIALCAPLEAIRLEHDARDESERRRAEHRFNKCISALSEDSFALRNPPYLASLIKRSQRSSDCSTASTWRYPGKRRNTARSCCRSRFEDTHLFDRFFVSLSASTVPGYSHKCHYPSVS